MERTSDTQSHPAYKCGRLLAVIERIQNASIGVSTLTDRYYGSASTTPASVFGVLLRMTQPHLSKLRRDREGLAIYYERALQDAMPDQFPNTLTLVEQGLFALGYYHQRREFFKSSAADEEATGETDSDQLTIEEVNEDENA